MKRILIFESVKEKRKALALAIRAQLTETGAEHVEIVCFHPNDVFTKPVPEAAKAAFFGLRSMYDAEAARKFHQLRGEIPLIMVSDSEEYCLEARRFDTRDYLKRPFSGETLWKSLLRCAV